MAFFSRMNSRNEEFLTAKKYLETVSETINPVDFYHLGPEDFANMMHLYIDDWAHWYHTVYDYYKAKVNTPEERRDWDLWVSSGEFCATFMNELSRDYSKGNHWFR